jgi:coproporphyrinogen III oxidase-like Fe-S oxidoreductase
MDFKIHPYDFNKWILKYIQILPEELKKRIHHVQKYLKGCFVKGYTDFTLEKKTHNHIKFRDCVRDHLNSFKAMSD